MEFFFMKDRTIYSVSTPRMHERYISECVNDESMSVSQRIIKKRNIFRYVKGRKKRVWNF